MAERIGIAPRIETFDAPPTNLWLNGITSRCKLYEGIVDPVVSEVPENQWIVFHNTALSEVRIWTNVAGVLLKSAAFT